MNETEQTEQPEQCCLKPDLKLIKEDEKFTPMIGKFLTKIWECQNCKKLKASKVKL